MIANKMYIIPTKSYKRELLRSLVELQTSDGAAFFYLFLFQEIHYSCMLFRTLYHSLLAFNISMIYLLISIFHLM